jgi:hypothetical protein
MSNSLYHNDDKYLLQIKNYTSYLALVVIDNSPIDSTTVSFPKNIKKNFGYIHKYLRSGKNERLVIPLLSKSDDASKVFTASNYSSVGIGVNNYYYSVYLYLPWESAGSGWKLHIDNKYVDWKHDINLLSRY